MNLIGYRKPTLVTKCLGCGAQIRARSGAQLDKRVITHFRNCNVLRRESKSAVLMARGGGPAGGGPEELGGTAEKPPASFPGTQE